MTRVPKVWNRRDKKTPIDAVYVGRPTMWGNPFSYKPGTAAQFEVDSRAEAIEAYRKRLTPKLIALARTELKGYDLVCWCSPLPCHADVLLEIANEETL